MSDTTLGDGPLSVGTRRLETSPEGWKAAPGDILRAGEPPIDSAVESSPARPESALPSTADFLARMRVERSLWALQRRTAGRVLTRSERRLLAHYEQQLRALDESTPQ